MRFLGAVEGATKIVIVGVPYEGKVVFRKGAKEGPDRIRELSDSIEEYSIYSHRALPPFNDLGNIQLLTTKPEDMVECVKEAIGALIKSGKRVLVLGGDHTSSLGSILAHYERHPNLRLLHFDAHLDRRNDYLNESLNYATVIKRAEDILGRGRVYSFGIRSVAKEEEPFINPNIFELEALKPLTQIWSKISNYPLYMTFDFDILDPAIFPAVTNPEPCGINAQEAIKIIQLVAPSLVGADFVEYNASLDPTGRAGVLAAILVRELLVNLQNL